MAARHAIVRKLDDHRWEVRSKTPDGIVRVLFTVVGDTSRVCKAQKTPRRDLETARKRLRQLMSEDRLLDPDNTAVTLHTMEKTASALGKRLRIEFV